MQEIIQLAHWLSELSPTVTADDVFNEDHNCYMETDQGLHLVVSANPHGPTFDLVYFLFDVAEEQSIATLRDAMKLNCHAEKTLGGSLCFNEAQNTLLYRLSLNVDKLSSTELKNLLTNSSLRADGLIRELSGTCESTQAPSSSDPNFSANHFLRV